MKIDCHTEMIHVFTVPETHIEVWAGGTLREGYHMPGSILLSLNGVKPVLKMHNFPLGAELEMLYADPVVEIAWPDYDIPALPPVFWHDLGRVLIHHNKSISILCAGGHGRTGTALAILAVIMGIHKEDPVLWVRKRYCDSAVESDAQLKYVALVTGRRTKAKIQKPKLSTETMDWINKIGSIKYSK